MIFRKRGQIWDTLIPWIIAIVVLVLGLFAFVVLSGKGDGALTYIRDLVRFR